MAKKSRTMSFKWNYSGEALLNRLGFNQETEEYFAKTVIKYALPYTPYNPFDRKSHDLHIRGGAKITTSTSGAKITYPDVPYAPYQYNTDGEALGWKRATYGTRHGWLDYAWVVHKQEITGKVGSFRRWQCK